jgi:hypothetical protein
MEIEFLSAGWTSWLGTTAPRAMKRAASNALRRTGTAVQKSAIDLFRQRGIGRKIFGQKAAGARKIITRSKLRVRNGVLEQVIKMKGLAAIQERGGLIKEHIIRPKNAKALRFASGEIRRLVEKQKANYPAIPYAQRAVAQNAGKLQEELSKELRAFVAQKETA